MEKGGRETRPAAEAAIDRTGMTFPCTGIKKIGK